MNRGERLPLSAVMPYVQSFVDAWYGVAGAEAPRIERPYVTIQDIKADHPEWGQTSESLPVLILAERSKLLPSTIGKWLRRWKTGESDTIGFFDADALFTGLNRTGLWFQDPVLEVLREQFEAMSSDAPATVRPTANQKGGSE